MAISDSKISQRKRMAMGEGKIGFKDGGSLPAPKIDKSGVPMSPLTKAKRDNGIPGFKKGGRNRG